MSIQLDKKHEFNFMATGIGSVPTTQARETCHLILDHLPDIPFWPQFVKHRLQEQMNIQFTEGMPLLTLDEEQGTLKIGPGDPATELLAFYEHYLAEDTEYFAIGPGYAAGLHELLGILETRPGRDGDYIKGQTVGPITLAAAVQGKDGKPALYQAEIAEALAKGLAVKALWQIKSFEKLNRKILFFIDEPYLSGYGSAFTPIRRHEVIHLLEEIIRFIRERTTALIGIHCCGNTDWTMIIDAAPDILSFDAYDYMDAFLLYRDALTAFIEGGGYIAWGIVPTFQFTGRESVADLHARLDRGLAQLQSWGLDPISIARSSIITPSCGMGTMEQSTMIRALELLSGLSGAYRDA
jgi:hypothetical protein